jgi:hypothetical protein
LGLNAKKTTRSKERENGQLKTRVESNSRKHACARVPHVEIH